MAAIETILLEDDDSECEAAPDPVLKRVDKRKGTGFVTSKQVQNAESKVGFADQSQEAGAEPEIAQRIKGR